MDTVVIKNAVGGLDKILSVGRDALWEISREMYASETNDGPFGGFADSEAALEGTLEEVYDILLVILEAAQMTRPSLSS